MAVCEIPYALLPEIYSARKLQKKALQHARHITMSQVVEKANSLLSLSYFSNRC